MNVYNIVQDRGNPGRLDQTQGDESNFIKVFEKSLGAWTQSH